MSLLTAFSTTFRSFLAAPTEWTEKVWVNFQGWMILRGVGGAGWWCPRIAAAPPPHGTAARVQLQIAACRLQSQLGQEKVSERVSDFYPPVSARLINVRMPLRLVRNTASNPRPPLHACTHEARCQLDQTGQLAMMTPGGDLDSRARPWILHLSVSEAQLGPEEGCAVWFCCSCKI